MEKGVHNSFTSLSYGTVHKDTFTKLFLRNSKCKGLKNSTEKKKQQPLVREEETEKSRSEKARGNLNHLIKQTYEEKLFDAKGK